VINRIGYAQISDQRQEILETCSTHFALRAYSYFGGKDPSLQRKPLQTYYGGQFYHEEVNSTMRRSILP
jgi:hypothetical protein